MLFLPSFFSDFYQIGFLSLTYSSFYIPLLQFFFFYDIFFCCLLAQCYYYYDLLFLTLLLARSSLFSSSFQVPIVFLHFVLPFLFLCISYTEFLIPLILYPFPPLVTSIILSPMLLALFLHLYKVIGVEMLSVFNKVIFQFHIGCVQHSELLMLQYSHL